MLSRCVCVRRISLSDNSVKLGSVNLVRISSHVFHCISLGGEGNAQCPVLSGYPCNNVLRTTLGIPSETAAWQCFIIRPSLLDMAHLHTVAGNCDVEFRRTTVNEWTKSRLVTRHRQEYLNQWSPTGNCVDTSTITAHGDGRGQRILKLWFAVSPQFQ